MPEVPDDFKTGVNAGDKFITAEVLNGASSKVSYNGISSTINPGTQGIDGISIGARNRKYPMDKY